jgi:regulator of RNase E activity RraA
MKTIASLLLLTSVCSAPAQIFALDKDQMIRLTASNPYERFTDGRPKVPDALLEKVKGLTQEEVWGVLPGKGYPNFYEGNWMVLHPGKKLVGRVVTAQYMPVREDLNKISDEEASKRKWSRSPNQRVIDQLQKGDVLVVDLFGKVEGGTFVGDNLATAIFAATGNGFVIDGAVRDLDGIFPLDMGAYFRNVHPSAIRGAMLTGFNVPVRIGNSTVMPGDVILGDREGVSFIPPHLVQDVLNKAEETHIHDEWTKEKFLTGKYKSTDLYPTPADPALKKEYEEYKAKRLKR